MTPKLWMVEEGVSERSDERSIEGRDSISLLRLANVYKIKAWRVSFEKQ